jgi:hypothetical protein
MSFEIDIPPRFDYGRQVHRTEVTEHGAVFGTDALTLTLTLHPVREPDDARLAHISLDEGDLRLSIDLTAGDVRGLVLESAADGAATEDPGGRVPADVRRHGPRAHRLRDHPRRGARPEQTRYSASVSSRPVTVSIQRRVGRVRSRWHGAGAMRPGDHF